MESKFSQEVNKFGKKDGILALGVCLLSIFLVAIPSAVRNAGFPMPLFAVRIIEYIPIVIIIVIVLCKKQGFASIGLHKEKLWSAIRLGLLFSLITIVFNGIIPGIYGGFNQLTFASILSAFAISLLLATWEDILFVGFVTPRLYGLVKFGWIAIPIGAFLFALMHVPSWIMNDALYFGSWHYAWLSSLQFMRWCINHIFFFAIFKKYHSIVPVIIAHTINNSVWDLVGNVSAPFGINNYWIIFNGAQLLAAGALFWHMHKKEKKTTAQ